MFSVRPLPEFTAWLDRLKDNKVRGAVTERIKRLSFGLLGDFKAIGDGVMELRIDVGAGWRVLHATRRTDYRFACGWFQTHAEERCPTGKEVGRIAEERKGQR